VRIWVTQEVGDCGELLNPPTYHAELNGHSWDPGGLWLYCLAEAITESEFDYLLELGRWAAQHAPRDAYARPDKAVDWSTQPPHRYVKPVRRRRK
jgi:hypothetical protein